MWRWLAEADSRGDNQRFANMLATVREACQVFGDMCSAAYNSCSGSRVSRPAALTYSTLDAACQPYGTIVLNQVRLADISIAIVRLSHILADAALGPLLGHGPVVFIPYHSLSRYSTSRRGAWTSSSEFSSSSGASSRSCMRLILRMIIGSLRRSSLVSNYGIMSVHG